MAYPDVLLAQHPDIPTFKGYVMQTFKSQTLVYLVQMLGHLDGNHLGTPKFAHIVEFVICNQTSYFNFTILATS